MPASATGRQRKAGRRGVQERSERETGADERTTDQRAEGSTELLSTLLEELPEELARQVFAHASWTERRSDSYLRLAFLGDSVLALAVTAHLYPRLEAEQFGAGRLTKIRAQTVSGRSCKAVAERLGVPERLLHAAPDERGRDVVRGLATQRVLASVIEAVIGACYLNAGYERTAQAVVQAFIPEIEQALENPVDCKSALQELLAQRGERVKYRLVHADGPAHRRTFEVVATVDGETLGTGRGNTKKDAEQTAAREALDRLAEQGS
jgi:ribonuclease III